jgi:hypothetical protein
MKKYLIKSLDTENIFEIIISENSTTRFKLTVKNCVIGDLPKLLPITGLSGERNTFNTFELENVDYQDNCSNTIIPFPHGDNGTVDMIKTILEFVKAKYKYIKFIILTDASKISCGLSDISLFHLYISMHGKPWYEHKFNATFVARSEDDYVEYNSCLSLLKSPKFKHTVTFDDLNITSDEFKTNIISDLYRDANTIVDFNKNVKNYFNDKTKYCNFIKNYFIDFFNKNIVTNKQFINGKYLIDIKNIRLNNNYKKYE